MKGGESPEGRLERLPAELQLQIIGDLDYRSGTMLTQTNRYFHDIVNPQDVAKAAKTVFIKKPQRWKKHTVNTTFHTRSLNKVVSTVTAEYACFTCFKVRPMHAFAARQILRCNNWGQRSRAMRNDLRCCIDCQIAKRAMRHGAKVKLLLKLSTLFDDRIVVNLQVKE